MKYVERKTHLEFHPENDSDRAYLQKTFGAKGDFEHWCVANPIEKTPVSYEPRETRWRKFTAKVASLKKD